MNNKDIALEYMSYLNVMKIDYLRFKNDKVRCLLEDLKYDVDIEYFIDLYNAYLENMGKEMNQICLNNNAFFVDNFTSMKEVAMVASESYMYYDSSDKYVAFYDSYGVIKSYDEQTIYEIIEFDKEFIEWLFENETIIELSKIKELKNLITFLNHNDSQIKDEIQRLKDMQ